MAATDSLSRHRASPHDPVRSQGLFRVTRARRLELALAGAARHDRGNHVPPGPNWQQNDRPYEASRHATSSPLRINKFSSLVNQSRPSRSIFSFRPGRATTTMSAPVASFGRNNSNASRMSRLMWLRSTALPTLRDTDIPRRNGALASSGRGNEYTTRCRVDADLPRR